MKSKYRIKRKAKDGYYYPQVYRLLFWHDFCTVTYWGTRDTSFISQCEAERFLEDYVHDEALKAATKKENKENACIIEWPL